MPNIEITNNKQRTCHEHLTAMPALLKERPDGKEVRQVQDTGPKKIKEGTETKKEEDYEEPDFTRQARKRLVMI